MKKLISFLLLLIFAPAFVWAQSGIYVPGAPSIGNHTGVYLPVSSVSSTCPQGSNLGDGCTGITLNGITFIPNVSTGAFNAVSEATSAGASGFYQYATSTTYVGSGQTWTSAHPWSWNGAAIDYNVAYDTSHAMQDVTTVAVPNCTYFPTGRAGTGFGPNSSDPVFYCQGGTNLELAHLVFGPDAAAGFPNGVGPSKCVILEIGPTQNASGQTGNGTVSIHDNSFGMGPGCGSTVVEGTIDATGVLTVTQAFYGTVLDGQSVNITADSGSKVGTVQFSGGDGGTPCNGVPCTGTGGLGTYALSTGFIVTAKQNMQLGNQVPQVKADDGSGTGQSQYNIYFWNNRVDGYSRATDTMCGGTPCAEGGLSFLSQSGVRIIAFNAFLYNGARPIGGANLGKRDALSGFTSAIYRWGNYIEGMGAHPYGVHAELDEDDGYTSGSLNGPDQDSYNVILTQNFWNNTGTTTLLYKTTGADNSYTFSNSQADHNILIGNTTQKGAYPSGQQQPAFTIGSRITAAAIDFEHLVIWTNSKVQNNFVDLNVNATSVAGLECFKFANGTFTNPTDFGSGATANISLNTGNVVTGYNIAPKSVGCN